MVRKLRIVALLCLVTIGLCGCGELLFLEPTPLLMEAEENNILPTEFSFVAGTERPIAASQENGFPYIDGSLYYYGKDTLYRYDVEHNVRTTLCEDPLCGHDDDGCPFGEYLECQYFDGLWYLTKQGVEKDGSPYLYYSRYDPTDGEEELLIRNDGGTYNRNVSLLAYNGYLYYYEVSVQEDGDAQSYQSTLCRTAIESKNRTKEYLLTFDSHMTDLLLCAREERLYFCAYGEGLYYILTDGTDGYAKHFFYRTEDERFGLLMDGCTMRGNSFYLCEWLGERSYFYRVDLDGNKTPLADWEGGAVNCFFTEKGMYYRVRAYKVIGLSDDGSGTGAAEIKIEKPNIFFVDYEGAITAVLEDFSQDFAATCIIEEITVVGRYIYTQYRHYGDTLKPLYENTDYSGVLRGLMRIDMTTGDVIYVSGGN